MSLADRVGALMAIPGRLMPCFSRSTASLRTLQWTSLAVLLTTSSSICPSESRIILPGWTSWTNSW